MSTKNGETTRPGLRYIGDGAALPNVPARHLSADEADQLDRAALLASGLYEEAS